MLQRRGGECERRSRVLKRRRECGGEEEDLER